MNAIAFIVFSHSPYLRVRYVYINYLLFMKKNLDSGKCFEFFCYVVMLSYRRLAGVQKLHFGFIFFHI